MSQLKGKSLNSLENHPLPKYAYVGIIRANMFLKTNVRLAGA
jgi:hypothetical protein